MFLNATFQKHSPLLWHLMTITSMNGSYFTVNFLFFFFFFFSNKIASCRFAKSLFWQILFSFRRMNWRKQNWQFEREIFFSLHFFSFRLLFEVMSATWTGLIYKALLVCFLSPIGEWAIVVCRTKLKTVFGSRNKNKSWMNSEGGLLVLLALKLLAARNFNSNIPLERTSV